MTRRDAGLELPALLYGLGVGALLGASATALLPAGGESFVYLFGVLAVLVGYYREKAINAASMTWEAVSDE